MKNVHVYIREIRLYLYKSQHATGDPLHIGKDGAIRIVRTICALNNNAISDAQVTVKNVKKVLVKYKECKEGHSQV